VEEAKSKHILSIKSAYISVEPFHLGRYVDEQFSASTSERAVTATALLLPFAGSSGASSPIGS
jgi:hypothetical protein